MKALIQSNNKILLIKSLVLLILLITCFTIVYYNWYYTRGTLYGIFSINMFNDIVYLSSVFKIILETSLVSLLLFVLFVYLKIKITWSKILYLVIFAEFVFLLQTVAEFLFLSFYKTNISNDFYSLSLYNLINTEQTPNYLYYILQTANLWELLFVLALAYLFKNIFNRSFIKSFGLVLLAYGIPLSIWMIFVTFIQIIQL